MSLNYPCPSITSNQMTSSITELPGIYRDRVWEKYLIISAAADASHEETYKHKVGSDAWLIGCGKTNGLRQAAIILLENA